MVYGPPGWLRPPGPDPIGANILGSWTGRRVFRGGSRKCRRSASMRRRRSERVELGHDRLQQGSDDQGTPARAGGGLSSVRPRPAGRFPFPSLPFQRLHFPSKRASKRFHCFPKVAKSCKKFPRIGTYQWLRGGSGRKKFPPADARPSVGAPGSGSPRRLDIGRVSRVSPRSSGPRPRAMPVL